MIELVVTGGQTGADQAGWRAARTVGIRTGGWLPRGWLTESGPRPDFADLYGAREHSSPRYEDRTPLNVADATATVLFGDVTSRGSRLAYRCYREASGASGKDPGIYYSRPGWIAVARWPSTGKLNYGPEDVAAMLLNMDHHVVNIAGNRESVSPGIGAWVERYLVEVFRFVQQEV